MIHQSKHSGASNPFEITNQLESAGQFEPGPLRTASLGAHDMNDIYGQHQRHERHVRHVH